MWAAGKAGFLVQQDLAWENLPGTLASGKQRRVTLPLPLSLPGGSFPLGHLPQSNITVQEKKL